MSLKSRLRKFGFEKFSNAFAEYVITFRPEFETYLQVVKMDDLSFAAFSIPSQNSKVHQPLIFSVGSDHSILVHWFEIKPGLLWDQEFSNTADWNRDPKNWQGETPGDSETFDAGLALIDLILQEQVVPYVHHSRMKDYGAYGYCAVNLLETQIKEQRTEGGSAVFRSWRGTYDRDLNYKL